MSCFLEASTLSYMNNCFRRNCCIFKTANSRDLLVVIKYSDKTITFCPRVIYEHILASRVQALRDPPLCTVRVELII